MVVNCVDLLIDHLLMNYFRASGKNYFENNLLEPLFWKIIVKAFWKDNLQKSLKIWNVIEREF